jgi:hypothetical protein
VDHEQRFAAVCGNGHVATQFLRTPGQPGVGEVPNLCRECSAPIYTKCPACDAPILGDRMYPGVIGFDSDPIPWFCHDCGKPYLWASADQMRKWVESRLKFDQDLDEDVQDELLGALAVLTPDEPKAAPMDFTKFKETLKRLPAVYEDVRPFLPVLRDLFT